MSDAHVLALALGVILGTKAATPEPRWPMLPSIARVRVDVTPTHLVVTRDVTLPRGDWTTGDLTMHVAYEATVPVALDAQLIAAGDGELSASKAAHGEPLVVDFAQRSALPLFGAKELVGANVTVPQALFSKLLAPGNMAILRVREIVRVPPSRADGERLLLVRLGAANGVPLTLARIEVAHGEGAPPLAEVHAELCGRDASREPLYVLSGPGESKPDPQAVAPVLATRHVSDDLCVRFR